MVNVLSRETMLRKVREQSGQTVSSMAKALNMRPSRYYMIEVAERPATPEIAAHIACLLKVKVDDIFLPRGFTARETSEVLKLKLAKKVEAKRFPREF